LGKAGTTLIEANMSRVVRFRAGAPWLVAAALAAPWANAAVLPAGYHLVDLGSIAGGSAANAITADGFAAGYDLFGPSTPHAVLFASGGVVDLGTLGGDASLANAVSSGGRVVGWARLADATRHAFLHDADGMHDLGTLGGTYSIAFAINDAGTVVGTSAIPDPPGEMPFVWTEGAGMRALPLPPGSGGQALAVNDAGTIVGYVIDPGGPTVAFRSDGTTIERLLPLDKPVTKAYGVSRSGIAAGYGLTGEGYAHFHAALWRGNAVTDLGALAGGHSVAYGVNDAGQAVGFSYTAEGVQVATLFLQSGVVDLDAALAMGGWRLEVATGITEDGVISGLGTYGGLSRAFALVPDALHQGPWGTPAPVARPALAAWPAPMRDSGVLELALPEADRGRVVLYDIGGRRVGELASGDFASGRWRIAIGSDVLARAGSGVFFARFEGERSHASQRLVIVR
jgi:probable HAF family extracellular repeat protein